LFLSNPEAEARKIQKTSWGFLGILERDIRKFLTRFCQIYYLFGDKI